MTRSHLLIVAATALLVSLYALRSMSADAPASVAHPAAMATTAEETTSASPAPAAALAAVPVAPVQAPKAERVAVEVPEKVSPREAQLVDRVRASGPASGAWTEAARALAGAAQVECHNLGCIATSSYADELTFETADEALTESAAFKGYQGWRHRSVHKDENGRVVATWFFMNPTQS